MSLARLAKMPRRQEHRLEVRGIVCEPELFPTLFYAVCLLWVHRHYTAGVRVMQVSFRAEMLAVAL